MFGSDAQADASKMVHFGRLQDVASRFKYKQAKPLRHVRTTAGTEFGQSSPGTPRERMGIHRQLHQDAGDSISFEQFEPRERKHRKHRKQIQEI